MSSNSPMKDNYPSSEENTVASSSTKAWTAEQLAKMEENRQRALAKLKLAESMSKVESAEEEGLQLKQIEIEAERHISETTPCKMTLANGKSCGKCPVDSDLSEYFEEFICKSCKYNAGDEYKLISRTEGTASFLVPEDSIRTLKYMTKENPHHPGWTPMKLYLRKHILQLSLERFGSLAALDLEKKKRDAAKFERNLHKTDDILAKQTAVYRDNLQKGLESAAVHTEAVSLLEQASGKKRSSSSNGPKSNLNAKRKRMVSGFLACLK